LDEKNQPSQPQERVRFEVKDEGQGLTKEDQEKLFGKFQRLSARPTGGESSTGLGLSIARQLVELQGGKILAESAGKDKGSLFIVELPAYQKKQ
ncbi:MAG: ATP-binding protein, partial [Chlorobiales bacterium]|nr:ATP-binding protein [Chlorobiales bacterium]